jgi:uncharacterized protein YdeI (YjbR/CyaY-like superfamily)
MAPDSLPVLSFADAREFDAWLEEHHADSPGLWLKIAKKSADGARSYPRSRRG